MTLFSNADNYSRFVPGYQENIGFSYSAGTFSVQGARGALSQSNAAYVSIQDSAAPGQQRLYRIIANQTFTDGAAGSIATQRFGLTAADVWGANNLPFFVYAVINSAQTAPVFMVSRNPSAKVAPAAASIGQSGAVVNVGQADFFSLSAITASNYAGQPCTYIGCFQMQFAGATNSWTVQALSAGIDGPGLNFDTKLFNYPTHVFGAATGSFFLANGGTAPIYTTQQETYAIRRDGHCVVNLSLITNSTAGAGAVAATLTIPYGQITTGSPCLGQMYYLSPGTPFGFIVVSSGTTGLQQVGFEQSAVATVLNTSFVATTTATMFIEFQAFIS